MKKAPGHATRALFLQACRMRKINYFFLHLHYPDHTGSRFQEQTN